MDTANSMILFPPHSFVRQNIEEKFDWRNGVIEITMFPQQIAAGVSEKGDVAITGVNPNTGMTITLMVESSNWKEVYKKLGALRGVGIYKANRIISAVDNDDA